MHRRDARELLLSALYRHEFQPVSVDELFEETDPGDQRAYIEGSFRGIVAQLPEIDRLLREKTIGWRLERLALLDRNILRIGVYELLHDDDIPPEVALDEAVELAKKFGTQPAQRFVNGILDRIWKEYRERQTS
jgi:transcription antitermination protein NusB